MEKKTTVTVLIPCRDGEKTLPSTIESIQAQTVPTSIVVGDDHSLDSTPEIIEKYNVVSWRHPTREPKNYDRVPLLLNMAWRRAPPSDYIMISGDDQVFPPDFCERVINFMEKDGVLLASGYNESRGYGKTKAPTGAGRIVTTTIYKRLEPLPLISGWDTWMLYKLTAWGIPYQMYPVAKRHMKWRKKRPTFGQAAHILGRPLIYTLFRSLKEIIGGDAILALSILLGHLEYKFRRIPKMDIAPFVQRKSLLRLGGAIIGLPLKFKRRLIR